MTSCLTLVACGNRKNNDALGADGGVYVDESLGNRSLVACVQRGGLQNLGGMATSDVGIDFVRGQADLSAIYTVPAGGSNTLIQQVGFKDSVVTRNTIIYSQFKRPENLRAVVDDRGNELLAFINPDDQNRNKVFVVFRKTTGVVQFASRPEASVIAFDLRALGGGQFVLAWVEREQVNGEATFKLRRATFDFQGTIVGPTDVIEGNAGVQFSLSQGNGVPGIIYTTFDGKPFGIYDLWYQKFNPRSGVREGAPLQIARDRPIAGVPVAVDVASGRTFVAWTEAEDKARSVIHTWSIGPRGLLGSEKRLMRGQTADSPALIYYGGFVLMAYREGSGAAQGVTFEWYADTGERVTMSTQTFRTSNQSMDRLRLGVSQEGLVALTWRDQSQGQQLRVGFVDCLD